MATTVKSANSSRSIMALNELLNQYSSINTVKNYRLGLRKFFIPIYGGTFSHCDPGILNVYCERYLAEIHDGRDYIGDLISFQKSIDVPKTQGVYTAAGREWLLFHDIELSQKQQRILAKSKLTNEAVTNKKLFTISDLRKFIF